MPSIVDEAQVFFEHTAAAADTYNLWGQVPVKSNGPLVHYYNLTPGKVTHSGKTGMNSGTETSSFRPWVTRLPWCRNFS